LGVWDFDGFYEKFKTLGAKRYFVKYTEKTAKKNYMKYLVKKYRKYTVERIVKKNYDANKTKKYFRLFLKTFSYSMTVAGLSKKKALCFILRKTKTQFDFFKHGMYIPASETGKLTHSYIDEYFAETITDYQGNTCIMSEQSFIHLENADYHLTLARQYRDFLQGRKDFAHK
jgi:hypothetical protein